MSKNLTRKGLAFGALVALGSSVLAGAPAYAADTVVLAANYSSDTTLATSVTGTFSLNASLAPGSVAANIAQLKYKVVTAAGTQADVVSTGTGTVSANSGTAGAGVIVTPNLPTTTSTNALAVSINGATSTTATKTVDVTAFIDSNNNALFDTGEASATQTVTFRKFSEITGTSTVTAASAGDTTVAGTFKFTNINNQSIPAAQVGANFTLANGNAIPSATITDVAVGAHTPDTATTAGYAVITATANGFAVGDFVTVANAGGATGYNATYQVTAATTNTFTVKTATTGAITGTSTTATLASRTVKAGVAYSTTNGNFGFKSSAVTALVAGQIIKIQPLLNNASPAAALAVGDTTMTIGSSEAATVAARALWSLSAGTVLSKTVGAATLTSAAGSNTTATAPADSTYTASAALDSEKTVTFTAKSGTSATTAKAWAGQTVKVTVTTTTLSTTKTLTVNGTAYSANTALPGATGVAALSLTTDADGKVSIKYATSGYGNTNSVVFVATLENSKSQITVADTTREYVSKSYISNYEDAASTTDGAAVSVKFVVIDQFGGAPANNALKITADKTATTQTLGSVTAGAGDSFALVTDGAATLTLTDNGTGVGADSYTFDMKSLDALGAETDLTPAKFGSFTVNIKSAADNTPGVVVLTTGANTTELGKDSAKVNYLKATTTNGASDATNATLLVYSDFASADTRNVAVAAPTQTSNAGTDISGASTNVAGNGGKLVINGYVAAADTATTYGETIPGSTVTLTGAGKQFVADQDGAGTVFGSDSVTIQTDSNGRFQVAVYSHLAGKQIITVTSGAAKSTIALYFKAAVVADASAVTVKVADGSAQFQSGRALDVTVTVADKFGNAVVTTGTAGTDTGVLTLSQTGAGYLANTGLVVTDSTGVYSTKLITNAGDLGTSTIKASFDVTDATAADIVTTTSSEFGITDVTDISSAGKAIYVNTEFAKGKVVTVYIDGKRMPVKAAEATDNAVERKYTQKKAGKHTVTVRVSGGVVASETVVTTK